VGKHLLNAVTVQAISNAGIKVGLQPYSETLLADLRRDHGEDYFFKREGATDNICSVALKEGLEPIGTRSETRQVSDSPQLLASLTTEALVRYFKGFDRPVVKLRPLSILSSKSPNLIPSH
jgi:hypothetical protein